MRRAPIEVFLGVVTHDSSCSCVASLVLRDTLPPSGAAQRVVTPVIRRAPNIGTQARSFAAENSFKRRMKMNAQPTVHSHIEITDTLVRLYVFLAQHMDRCISEAVRISYPEAELQSHLASTRATIQ